MGWLTQRLGNGWWGTVDGDNPNLPPQVWVAGGTVNTSGGGSGVFPIVTTLNPSLPIGTVVYYQNGLFGVAKGLLLSLTNTPLFIKMIVTDHGLQRIN
jgi:hypothetical protein